MRFPAKIVMLMLPVFLAGCIHFPFHKQKKTPPQVTAPPVVNTPPESAPQPAEVTPLPVVKPVTPPPPLVVAVQPEPKPRPPVVHRHKHTAKPVQQASIEPPALGPNATPAISAIGQLTSGEPSELSRKTQSSIETTERGLNGIHRKLNEAEQKTAAQIREFLKQARAAMKTGDVDGASTLAAKAKVLLGELTQ